MIQILKGEIKTEAGYFGRGATVQLSRQEEKRMIAAGRAEPVYPINDYPDSEDNDDLDELDRMTVPELRAYAHKAGLDLKNAKDKAAILNIIREAEPHE